MSAKDTLRRNKTDLLVILCGDRRLILNKVHQIDLITHREYNNLKSIAKEDEEGHVSELLDKVMGKGEDTCRGFLDLLLTDEDVKNTFPELRNKPLDDFRLLPKPVQACTGDNADVLPPETKRRKQDDPYELNSRPLGVCLIINNENFTDQTQRKGTNKDAQSLAEVFSWLGFTALMVKDQTKEQIVRVLKCFAAQSDLPELQELGVERWSGSGFAALQETPKHGDAFVCCILSHGQKGVVLGTDKERLPIKDVTATFKATAQSPLKGKPKVFLIQACQGAELHRGVLLGDLEADDCDSQCYIPQETDFLIALATVEDYVSYRHTVNGSWFVQSVCQQLKDGCPRNEDLIDILLRVNNEVGQKEGDSGHPGARKQMPEVRFTLRKRLVLSPCDD